MLTAPCSFKDNGFNKNDDYYNTRKSIGAILRGPFNSFN